MDNRDPIVKSSRYRWIGFSLTLVVGCATTTDRSEMSTADRLERVIGCWRLSGQQDQPTPDIIHIDAAVANPADRADQRTVRRLDREGLVLRHDGEGFAFRDAWRVDATRDSIHLTLTNGLFGSSWVLALPARDGASELMRGRSQAFTDVYPVPNYPDRPVHATRVACQVAEDSVSGVE
jgi:hypothetical protein